MKDLISEYKELLELKIQIERKLATLPKGYISEKTIGGNKYFYLQTRNGSTVESKYIKNVDEIKSEIALRKKYEAELPTVTKRITELESAAKILSKALFRKLKVLKLSTGMDNISSAEREKRISFSDAMSSIEGVPISDKVKSDLVSWKNGNITFLSIFEQTLKRYGFAAEV